MLDFLVYTVQSVQANQNYQQGSVPTYDWQQAWEFSPQETDGVIDHAVVMLRISLAQNGPVALPYDLEIESFSTMHLSGWPDLADAEKVAIVVQARQYVTGMVRERIRMLTSDGPWGPLIMPPLPIN